MGLSLGNVYKFPGLLGILKHENTPIYSHTKFAQSFAAHLTHTAQTITRHNLEDIIKMGILARIVSLYAAFSDTLHLVIAQIQRYHDYGNVLRDCLCINYLLHHVPIVKQGIRMHRPSTGVLMRSLSPTTSNECSTRA